MLSAQRTRRAWICGPAVGLLVLILGCYPPAPPAKSDGSQPPSSQPADAALAPASQWNALWMQGKKVGYAHTTTTPIEREGQKLVKIDIESHLSIQRFGISTEMEVRTSSLETPEGQIVTAEATTVLSPQTMTVSARVADGKLWVRTGGQPNETSRDWSPDIQGFDGDERSLERRPMQPGEHRTLKLLAPALNQLEVATINMTARDLENVDLPSGSRKLLRIDRILTQGGIKTTSTGWTDEHGQTLKSHTDIMDLLVYRTTREAALATGNADKLDLGLSTIVKLTAPLEGAHRTHKVRYQVKLSSGEPAEYFPSGPTQQVKPLGPHVAEITVIAVPPPATAAAPSAAPPAAEYLRPNAFIQSDDPTIVRLAHEASGNLKDPAAIALALEKYVAKSITKKNFSQGFASAAEVARSREGDCTEHAVLLAALARAMGIPARVAMGLVYADALQGFGFHMWTEVYLAGHWVALDATLGQGGVAAEHLKLSDSSLQDATTSSTLLPVAAVLGKLEIQVLEAE